MSRRGSRLLLALGAAALSLAAAEWFAGSAIEGRRRERDPAAPAIQLDPPRLSAQNAKLGIYNNPNYKGTRRFEDREIAVVTNSSGYRSNEEYRQNRSEAPIVAVVGDSFVIGLEVEEAALFSSLLEKKLNAQRLAERAVQVQNYGVGGTGPAHHLLRWRSDIRPRHPHVVVLTLFPPSDLGDVAEDGPLRPRYARDENGRIWDARGFVIGRPQPWWRRTALARLLMETLDGRVAPDPWEHYAVPRTERMERSWRDYQDLIGVLAKEARWAGARFLTIYIPGVKEIHPETWAEDRTKYAEKYPGAALDPEALRRGAAALAEALSLQFMDPTAVFLESNSQGRATHYAEDGHLNEHGHALLADEIFPVLDPLVDAVGPPP